MSTRLYYDPWAVYTLFKRVCQVQDEWVYTQVCEEFDTLPELVEYMLLHNIGCMFDPKTIVFEPAWSPLVNEDALFFPACDQALPFDNKDYWVCQQERCCSRTERLMGMMRSKDPYFYMLAQRELTLDRAQEAS